MNDFTTSDGLTRDVVEVIVDDFGDEVDDTLYFLSSRQGYILAQAEEMDDGLGEDDFANFEVDLFIFEDLNLLNPAADANILEDVDGDVNYC